MKIELIEKIEGEAYLVWEGKKPWIVFESSRGIEALLQGRSLWDALVITPRVCGICGHAHLAAAARALEDLLDVEPSNKAKCIRTITQSAEMLQNHLKWFYLTIVPLTLKKQKFLQIHPAIVAINALSAIFSGQWPHSSYMIPGGVTCDPSALELLKAKGYIKKLHTVWQMVQEDLKRVQEFLRLNGLAGVGRGYDRFIIASEAKKLFATRSSNIDIGLVRTYEQAKTAAFGVHYKDYHYETGPLARMMLQSNPSIRKLHRRYKDGLITRISARVMEIALLLKRIEQALESIELDEPSWKEAPKIASGVGIGCVEAARGSLIHKVVAKEGVIERYEIITPTQWNLANGNENEAGVAIKALLDAPREWSELVFKSFDVCSVCTTH